MDNWLETPKYESICLNLSCHVQNRLLVVHRIFFTVTIVQCKTIAIKKMYRARNWKETFWPLSADFFSERPSENSCSSPHSPLLSVSCEESHSCSQLGSLAQRREASCPALYKEVTGRTRADPAETSAMSITFQMSIFCSKVPLAFMFSSHLSGGYPLEIHLKGDAIFTKHVY